MQHEELFTKLGQILNLTIDFRKRRGFSKASWKLFPRLGIHSSYDQSIKLLEAIEDDHEDNELIGFWCKIGIRYCSMAAAQRIDWILVQNWYTILFDGCCARKIGIVFWMSHWVSYT
eukprot:246468_1